MPAPIIKQTVITCFFLAFSFLPLQVKCNGVSDQKTAAKTYFVSVAGSDSNPGTINKPMATLEAARDAARNSDKGLHRIVVLPGEYFLEKPFQLDSRDNGLTVEAEQQGSATLYGGVRVDDWESDGEKYWFTNIQGVKEGTLDFRALVVNGRLAEKARFPESGTFEHRQEWDVQVLPAVAGYWERQPKPEELRIMAYNPDDIPGSFDIRNAEVRIYHMWDESFVGIEHHDRENHVFTFSSPTTYPPGAFGKKEYVVFNTREGMTRPGQWYLDRTEGRLFYWPREDENMEDIKIVVPLLEKVICITGEDGSKARDITIRGLNIQATTTPLRPSGFGARVFDGAVNILHADRCALENLTICNAGGLGVRAVNTSGLRITGCHIYNTGAAGVKIRGRDSFLAHSHIHDLGLYFPGAVALYADHNQGMHIYRNKIHDAPYSGMILGRSDILVEENLVYRVMRELQDGGAIYSSGSNNITLRGNVVRDIISHGTGYGVSAYYFDEGSYDCLVEGNISIGVPRPTHNHICHDIIMRDNAFIHDGDMTLSFQRSSNYIFTGNKLIIGGELIINQPNALDVWKDNVIFRDMMNDGDAAKVSVIDSEMPDFPIPARRTNPARAVSVTKTPGIEEGLATGEWPGEFFRIEREPSRLSASGPPVQAKFAWDDENLYIGTIVTMFDPGKMSSGSIWGENDGMEISLGGYTAGGEPATFIIRSYIDGTVEGLAGDGLSGAAARKLADEINFDLNISQGRGGGWTGWWAVPLEEIGLNPEPGTVISFNMCAFVNEFGKWKCWEGSLDEEGESGDLNATGLLRFE